MLAETTTTAPHRGLPDYKFTKTRIWSFYDEKYRTYHHWENTRTGDYETRFPTKAEAVKSAKRFETGLRAEEKGHAYVQQFEDAPIEWLHEQTVRIEAVLTEERDPGHDPERQCYLAGMLTGYYQILSRRTTVHSSV